MFSHQSVKYVLHISSWKLEPLHVDAHLKRIGRLKLEIRNLREDPDRDFSVAIRWPPPPYLYSPKHLGMGGRRHVRRAPHVR